MTLFNQFKKGFFVFSFLIIILSILSLVTRGLNLGLDFNGGVEIEIEVKSRITTEEIEDIVQLQELHVISYGHENEFLIKLPADELFDRDAVENSLKESFASANIEVEVKKINRVGAEFSRTMFEQSLVALLAALVFMTIYVAIRFEFRLAIGALVALIHDPIVIFGFFSIFKMSFDLSTLTAILAIIGYSLNDTIVVFDRIRENFSKNRFVCPNIIVTMSARQTLSRTLVTSLLTFFVTSSLFLFGPEVLRSFAAALCIGIIVGTYSSIFIAGFIAVALGLNYLTLFPPNEEGKI